MKTEIDYTVDINDVLILWGHSMSAYDGYTFPQFFNEIKKAYANNYLPNRFKPKTFSEWVNAQIMVLAY